MRIGERNLYADARRLVGGRDPRPTGFAVRLRPTDAARSGEGLGMPALAALCGAMLGRHARGGAVAAGAMSLGGSVDPLPDAARIAELAVDKGARTLLLPVSARRRLDDLPDSVWTGLDIEFYADGPDGVFKALAE